MGRGVAGKAHSRVGSCLSLMEQTHLYRPGQMASPRTQAWILGPACSPLVEPWGREDGWSRGGGYGRSVKKQGPFGRGGRGSLVLPWLHPPQLLACRGCPRAGRWLCMDLVWGPG